jgi:ribonucleoside-diphosphate reductase subunit M2
MLKKKLSYDRVKQIVSEALEIEKEFVCDAIKCDMIGMNAELMKQYIDYCGMRLVKSLDLPAFIEVENPFEWMELLSLQGKSNFFEEHPTEYQQANVMGGATEFTIEADF